MKHPAPLFSYYGSKVRKSMYYPPPVHDTIIEPFAGAATYAMRYADRKVILYELDKTIYGILNYLIQASPNDILSLPIIPPYVSVHDYVWPCEEAKHLVGMWLCNAAQAPRLTLSAWGRAQ